MATESYDFAVTIPAGTAIANPLTTLTTFPLRRVTRIDWRVPTGANGVMGFRIGLKSVQYRPTQAGTWVIASGQTGFWDLDGNVHSQDWSVIGYNTGANPHTVYVTYHVQVIERDVPEPSVDLFDDSILRLGVS